MHPQLSVGCRQADVCGDAASLPFLSLMTRRAWSCSSMFFCTIRERNIWKSSVASTGWNTDCERRYNIDTHTHVSEVIEKFQPGGVRNKKPVSVQCLRKAVLT